MDADNIRRAKPLLGTFVEITAAGAARSDTEKAIELAFAAVAQVHRLMSFHNTDSDICHLNREASTRAVKVHPWTFQVLKTAIDLHRHSSGLFDITVAPVLQELGLLPHLQDDLSPVIIGTPKAEAVELLSDHGVSFRHSDVRIDLGGIAKGFAVDRAVEVLQEHGISGGIVNAGGDLAVFGPESYTIYIRDPCDPRRSMCRVKVNNNEALASTGARFDPLNSAEASGTAVIDPRTRKPVRMIDGATVRARSCMIADALTKIVMIAGESAIAVLDHYEASALLVSGGDVRVTPNWQSAIHLAA